MKMTQVYDTGSGSLAGTTARIVDGIMILGKRITKNDSKSIPQIFQRDKQRFVRTVADSVKLDIINDFWPKPGPLKYPYNGFLSANLLSQTEYVAPGTPFAPDKLSLIMSKGSLEGTNFIAGNSYKASDGAVNVAWNEVPRASGEDTDNMVVVVYDIGTKFPYYDMSTQRQDGGTGFTISKNLILTDLVFIIFPWRMDGTKQVRAQSITIAPIAG